MIVTVSDPGMDGFMQAKIEKNIHLINLLLSLKDNSYTYDLQIHRDGQIFC